jgi:predicted dehydrogenase
VLDATPHTISASGVSHVAGRPENIAYITLAFQNNLIAHFHVNWLAPVKLRRTIIGGSNKMIVYDDMEPSEKLKIYDKGLDISSDAESIYKTMVGYRTGDMLSPKLDITEALRVETAHFLDCIQTGKKPITDGEAGLRIVRILDAASRSLAANGQPVKLVKT